MKKADCLIIVTVIIAIAIVIELFFISKFFLSGKITFFNNSPQSRFSYEEPVSSKIASDVLVDDEVLNEFIDDMGLTNFNNKRIVLTKSDYKKFLAKNRKIIVIDENNNPVKTIYDEKKEKYKIHPSDTDFIDNPSAIPTYVPSGSKYTDKIKQAFKAWEIATENNIGFKYVDSPQKAYITVEFSEYLPEACLLEQAAGCARSYGNVSFKYDIIKHDKEGNTYVKMQQKQNKVSQKIFIAEHSADGMKIDDTLIYNIMLHEIGHALDLPHSVNPYSIMFPTTAYADSVSHISKRDVYLLEQKYNFKVSKYPNKPVPSNERVPNEGVYIIENPQHIKIFIPKSAKRSNAMKQACLSWAKATNYKYNFEYVDSPDVAMITVNFVEHIPQRLVKQMGQHPAAGLTLNVFTTVNTSKNGKVRVLRKADVYIPEYRVDGIKLADDELYIAMLHEMGHALGLNHSLNPDSIMNQFGRISLKILDADVQLLLENFEISKSLKN